MHVLGVPQDDAEIQCMVGVKDVMSPGSPSCRSGLDVELELDDHGGRLIGGGIPMS